MRIRFLQFCVITCMLLVSGLSYGQLKFGDKSTVGQTLTLDNEAGVATVDVTFNTDKGLSSAVWNDANQNYDISISKCQTNKGFQVNVYDESDAAVVNSDFRCRRYNSYENPAHVESVASLQAILDAYAVNDPQTSTSKQLPAHCLFDIAADNQAFGAWPGKYKKVEYGFNVKFASIVENDITFDIDTYDDGNTGATASYELTVYIGGTDAGNLVATVPDFYVSGSGVKNVSLAANAGIQVSDFSNANVYWFLKTSGTGTAIADDLFDPTIVFDNLNVSYNPPAWFAPKGGIEANVTLNNESSPELVRAGETTTFAFPLKTAKRATSLTITNDLVDNTKEPIFSIAETGALKANDGSGNYTVDVEYTFKASTFDGEHWSKPQIQVAAPVEGTADDDLMLYFDVAPAELGTYMDKFELDCGTRIWYEFNFQAANKIVGYITADKTMAETATSPDNDPVIQLLKADPEFAVDVQVVASDAVVDLSGYDVVVAQEGFSSSSAIFKPGGSLGLANIPVPFIYNKVWTLRDGYAVVSGGGSTTQMLPVCP